MTTCDEAVRKEFLEKFFDVIGSKCCEEVSLGYNLLVETHSGNTFAYHVSKRDNGRVLVSGAIDGLDTLRAYVRWKDIVNYFENINADVFTLYLIGGTAIRIHRNNRVEEEFPLS